MCQWTHPCSSNLCCSSVNGFLTFTLSRLITFKFCFAIMTKLLCFISELRLKVENQYSFHIIVIVCIVSPCIPQYFTSIRLLSSLLQLIGFLLCHSNGFSLTTLQQLVKYVIYFKFDAWLWEAEFWDDPQGPHFLVCRSSIIPTVWILWVLVLWLVMLYGTVDFKKGKLSA